MEPNGGVQRPWGICGVVSSTIRCLRVLHDEMQGGGERTGHVGREEGEHGVRCGEGCMLGYIRAEELGSFTQHPDTCAAFGLTFSGQSVLSVSDRDR